jgi:DNA-binding CsgD family transcriptional regulator
MEKNSEADIGSISFKKPDLERILRALQDGLYLVDGKGEILCVIQDVSSRQRPSKTLIATIEAMVADTSALGRTLLDKFTGRGERETDEKNALSLLTERERDVLGLICQGRGDGEMSDLLRLSPNTVRNHIASLYRKIGVNRRSAAILWAQEHGIICDELPAPRPSLRTRLPSEARPY